MKARTVFAEVWEEIYVRMVDVILLVLKFQPGTNLSIWDNAVQEGKGNRRVIERVPLGWWMDGLRSTGMPFKPTIIAGDGEAESGRIKKLVWDLVKVGKGIKQGQPGVLKDIVDREQIELVGVECPYSWPDMGGEEGDGVAKRWGCQSPGPGV